jgi:ATP-dependent protease ClpP protease subunit
MSKVLNIQKITDFNKEPMQNKLAVPAKKSNYSDSQYEEFAITCHPVKQFVYNIYLFGDIKSAQQFVGAIEVLGSAGPEDVVVIHLSTDGGDLDTTDTFLQAIKETEAHVVAKVSGGCHSCGTLIALAADEFQLSDNANFLIHNGGVFMGGKFSDFVLQSDHVQKYYKKVMHTTYEGFLLPLEIDNLLKGVDIWLSPEDFVRRHEQRNDYYMAQMKAEQEAIKKVAEEKPKRVRKPLNLAPTR